MNKIKDFFIKNKSVLITLFIFSILVYGYAGTNAIINLDGVDDFIVKNKISDYTLYLSVGRWGWSIIGSLFDFYPSPFLCLILNSFLFSVSGVLLSKIFNIKNKIFVVLLSMILIAFPVNIVAYTYMPWQYSIGIGYFVSIYSVYRIKNNEDVLNALLTGFLISFATSIYQTFIELIVVMTVITIIIELKSNNNFKKIFKYILYSLLCGVIGIILYYLLVNLSTFIFDIEMNSYQNAKGMFKLNFNAISFYFVKNLIGCFNINFGPFSSRIIESILFFLVYLSLMFYTYKFNIKKILLYIFLVFILIISPKILNFVQPYLWYHLITYLPYSVFFYGVISLFACEIDKLRKFKVFSVFYYGLVVLLGFVSFVFLINANKVFVMSRQSTESSFNYLNRIQMRIEILEGYGDLPNPKKYYFYYKNNLLDAFPFSEYAYIKSQGTTWTFNTINVDTIAAMNILGQNVVSSEFTYDELAEINQKVSKLKGYPDKESIFIYKDSVIIYIDFTNNM